MSAIDWNTTATALSAASATATGADKQILDEIYARLVKLGAALAHRFISAVSDAKDAWETAAEAAFDEAQEAADYVVTAEGGTPASPITWNAYSIAEIRARIGAASSATQNAFLQRALAAHSGALGTAFSFGPDDGAAYTRAPTRKDFTNQVFPGDPAVATIEREIYTVILEANSALALAAYP